MLAPIVAFFVKTPKTFALSRLLQKKIVTVFDTSYPHTAQSLARLQYFNNTYEDTYCILYLCHRHHHHQSFNTIMVMVVLCVFFLVFLKVLFCTHSRIHSFFDLFCAYVCIHVFMYSCGMYLCTRILKTT